MERVLKSGLVKVLILFTIFLGLGQSVLATTVIMPSDDNMIIEARAIVRGKVLSVGSALDEQQNRIFTYTTVRVQEVLKGQIFERKIVIKEEGGQVGMRGTRIFGTPEFKVDENVLLYLDTWADGSLRVHQFFLGKFSIIDDPATGKTMAVRSLADEDVVVVGNLPQSDQPKGNTTNRMELSAYAELVRARLAANLQTSQAFEERYYSGVSLLTRPPEFATKSKRGEIQPQYVFLAPGSPPRWFEIDSGQAVSFNVNPAGAFTPNYVADVQSAMNAWSTISGSALRVVYAGSTDQCSPSGFNTIIFNGCDGRWAPSSSCQGILALGGCSWFGTTKVVNGTTFYQATGGFVTMNPNASCFFTGQDCNTSEVLTHEMGHALGLGHTLDSTATMYAIAHFDGRCATAKPDDQAAMVFIYPGSGGGPGPLAITTSSLPAATTGTVYNQALAATGGTPAYNWSLVAGQGTLPTGLSLSTGGIISGTPGTMGTFNFTVNVTDSASPAASVQKALSIVVSATGGLALDSQFVTQSVPANVAPGQSFNVDLKFLNTGTQSWSAGANFFVVSQNPALNQTWGGNGVSLGGNVINSGQQLDAAFAVTAPTTPGTYNFQWQMYKNDGTAFFGQMSTNVAIQVGGVSARKAPFDFDGDGRSELGFYRNGLWGVLKSSQNFGSNNAQFFSWGSSGTQPLVFDFDGDGKPDLAYIVPPTGGQSSAYAILQSSTGYSFASGQVLFVPAGFPSLGDTPVVGDFDGDGKADPGIWRSSQGVWMIPLSSSNYSSYIFAQWGQSGDVPIVCDIDGDGKADIGFYRNGLWGFLKSSQGYSLANAQFFSWGGSGLTPIVADFDGDGKPDLAYVVPATGGQSATYAILKSTTGYSFASGQVLFIPAGFPSLGDTPVIGDFDGDGRADPGIWRASQGVWIIPLSSTNYSTVIYAQWGQGSDVALPSSLTQN